MKTSTTVIAGLAALTALALYSKHSNGSYNPLALLSSGPPLPKTTPQLTPGTPVATTPPAPSGVSPEVEAAKTALKSIPASFPNSPEVAAATNTVQNAAPNSPEAKAALNLLQGLPSSPEAQAALSLLQAQSTKPTTFVPGVIDEPVVKNGDVVNVDMFRSGMNLPQNIPLVGLIFMNVDSLEAGAPDKFLASFVSPEFRIFGQQTVNRSAIVAKA
jgi:hypothetical protein